MNNEFIDLGYVKNLIIKNRIIIIVTMAICLCLGVLFSINNSFVYQAETSLIFGRINGLSFPFLLIKIYIFIIFINFAIFII